MLRKRGVQDALLPESSFGVESSCEDPSEIDLRLSAQCQGLAGKVKVCRDGSFSFKQTEVSIIICIIIDTPPTRSDATRPQTMYSAVEAGVSLQEPSARQKLCSQCCCNSATCDIQVRRQCNAKSLPVMDHNISVLAL